MVGGGQGALPIRESRRGHHLRARLNSNPAIDDAQLLVLDDAHAAADSVASPWSLVVRRVDHRGTYLSLLSALADGLDPLVVTRLNEDSPDAAYRTSTYLVSPVAARTAAATVGTIFERPRRSRARPRCRRAPRIRSARLRTIWRSAWCTYHTNRS